MEFEYRSPEHESEPKIVVNPPVAELFLSGDFSADPEISQQLVRRRELLEAIHRVLDKIPYPLRPVESLGLHDTELTEMYSSFTELLKDPDNERLALYFPFELMPAGAWPDASDDALEAMMEFRYAYLEAWRKLLVVHDVRANFVDGDLMEVDRREGDVPRVVKAAHLVPGLIERGMLTGSEVVSIIEAADDPLLKTCLADGLRVANDLELLQSADRLAVYHSDDPLVQELSGTLIEKPIPKADRPRADFSFVPRRLAAQLQDIGRIDEQDAAPNRKKWLKSQFIDDVVSRMAYETSAKIADADFEPEILHDPLVARVYIESAMTAVQENPQVFGKVKNSLEFLWQHDAPELVAALTTAYRYLFRMGLLSDIDLASKNILLPTLHGPLSENLLHMQDELAWLENAVDVMRTDQEIAESAYPVVMLYGSRLKGYGEPASDVDVGVFLKPGAHRDAVERLAQLFGGEPVEFWLEETDSGLAIQDQEFRLHVADPFWTHMLFSAAWVGDEAAMKELHEKLLVNYFTDTGKEAEGRTDRQRYLERIEQDLLQYRLMHKGYKKHFPTRGLTAKHADKVDGSSAFWDSDYRLAATRLFINYVFLPKI